MPADRNELESLNRVQLVERARATGIERPEVLTRLELIDEILSAAIADTQERKVARGLLGRARDLVAKVVEKGLNLPDAAQRLRTLAPPLSAWRRGPAPIATVSLAEIYAGQGHDKLALKVLDEVLDREPDHAYARKLRDTVLQARDVPAPPPASPSPRIPTFRKDPVAHVHAPIEHDAAPQPEPEHVAAGAVLKPCEPASNELRAPEVPTEDGVHLEVDHDRALVQWHLRPRSFARARYARPDGSLAIRILYFVPCWEGPRASIQDETIDALRGRMACDLPSNAEGLCVALGWLTSEGFTAMATSASP